MTPAEFQIGAMVEITPDDQKSLQESGGEMFRLARRGGGKWFYRYVKAHMRSAATIKKIMARSHATEAPARGLRH